MDKIFRCKGVPAISLAFGSISVLTIVGIGIGFILIWNTASILTGISLVLLSFFLVSRWERDVFFTPEGITVTFFIGRDLKVSYKDCKKMYKSNDGVLPAPINVLRYKKNSFEKKITFVCEDSELNAICDEYFNGFQPKEHNKA